MWQYMAILELGGLRTFMYDAYIESPEVIVDDYYYDDDDDLHGESCVGLGKRNSIPNSLPLVTKTLSMPLSVPKRPLPSVPTECP